MIVKTKMERKFQPIEVTITIESIEEARTMWARMCIGNDILRTIGTGEEFQKVSEQMSINTGELYSVFDRILKSNNVI